MGIQLRTDRRLNFYKKGDEVIGEYFATVCGAGTRRK
jgi:hypothetical protein